MKLHEQIEESCAAIRSLLAQEARLLQIATSIRDALLAGNTLYVCGNGGSAAESQHLATELLGRFRSNRRALPAVALTADGTLLTCLLNDFPPEQIFSRQLHGLARPGDLLMVLSTSGQSPNILEALRAARELGIQSLGLLGRDGGPAATLTDLPLIIGSSQTARIQEAHLFAIHAICEVIEAAFA